MRIKKIGGTDTCETCKNAVFCYSWGEYRCLKKCETVRKPENIDCPDYEKDKTKEERYCQCQTCVERRFGRVY